VKYRKGIHAGAYAPHSDSKSAIITEGKAAVFDRITRANGTSEFEDFLDSLSEKDAAKLLAVISKVETLGLQIAIRMQWVRKLEDDLYELRSQQGRDIQRAIYFHVGANCYVITHGFTKKSQRTPAREIRHAKELRRRYRMGETK
jgi:phage-related protein